MQKDLLNRLRDMPKGQLVTIIVVVVGFFVLLDLNSRLSTLYTLRQDVDTDSTKVVALYATEVFLRTEVAKMDNVQKLEEFGRESGYIQPGDIPIAPIPVKDPDASLDALTVDENEKPPRLQNWELWWFLLFEDE
jgi:cell division protein FtsB